MKKTATFLKKQLLAVAMLALALAVQAQTKTENTVTNPQME